MISTVRDVVNIQSGVFGFVVVKVWVVVVGVVDQDTAVCIITFVDISNAFAKSNGEYIIHAEEVADHVLQGKEYLRCVLTC